MRQLWTANAEEPLQSGPKVATMLEAFDLRSEPTYTY